MNRSILLIICDFLLLSFLGLAQFDNPKQVDTTDIALKSGGNTVQDDLIAMLEASLESERQDRTVITETLEKTEQELQESKEAIATISSEHDALAKEHDQTVYHLEELKKEQERQDQELAQIIAEKSAAQERLRFTQEQLNQDRESLQTAYESLEAMKSENIASELEKVQLENQIKIYETQLKISEENLKLASMEIDTLEAEKVSIEERANTVAKGITTLAETTSQILENQPLSSNIIYENFKDSIALIELEITQQGVFSTYTKKYSAITVVAEYPNGKYAIIHAKDTPFDVEHMSQRILIATAKIRYKEEERDLEEITFIAGAPRLIAIPIADDVAAEMNLPTFKATTNPNLFSEAIIVDHENARYEDVQLTLEPNLKNYVRIEDKGLKASQRVRRNEGDIIFDRSGKLLGLMINKQYAAILEHFNPTQTIELGQGFNDSQADDAIHIQRLVYKHLPRNLK